MNKGPKICRGCHQSSVPFRSKYAHYCNFCFEGVTKTRKRYQREYNQAKVVAVNRLRALHQDEYEDLMAEELNLIRTGQVPSNY